MTEVHPPSPRLATPPWQPKDGPASGAGGRGPPQSARLGQLRGNGPTNGVDGALSSPLAGGAVGLSSPAPVPRDGIGGGVGVGGDGGGGVTTTTYTSRFMSAAAREVREVRVTRETGAPQDQPPQAPSPARPVSAPPSGRAAARFHFFADDRAPGELQRLEREAIKRRQEFKNKVRDLEFQIAGWTARLANEAVERDREYEDLVQRAAGAPLEAAVERIMRRMEERLTGPFSGPRADEDDDDDGADGGGGRGAAATGDGSENDKEKGKKRCPSLPELEARVSRLDAALLEHAHRSAYDARVAHLDSVRSRLREEAYPALRLEAAKADKREGGMVRTFEGAAASAAHALAEENAARVAKMGMLKEEVEREAGEKATYDERRLEAWLGEVRKLREALDEERMERQQADERVLEQIIRTREALQRTVLESLADS